MLHYLGTRAHLYTVRRFLGEWGRPLAPHVRVLAYEDLHTRRHLDFGAYVFSDLERLSPQDLEAAARVRATLAERWGDRAPLLNHPTVSLRRFELLRRLRCEGINRFEVYRATEHRLPRRYPVFLRREDDHVGPVGAAVQTKKELLERLGALRRNGHSLDRILITEFLDTADEHGIYRKYSAFIVGDRILPRHLFFSADWNVKFPDRITPPEIREELAYLQTNPHESTLRQVFGLAGIDYGRIDYAFSDGRMQVWEINTNPWVMSFADAGAADRRAAHRLFWVAMCRALIAQLPRGLEPPALNPLWRAPMSSHRRLWQAAGLGRWYAPLAGRLRAVRKWKRSAPPERGRRQAAGG